MPTASIVAAEARPQVIMMRAIHSRAPTFASIRLLAISKQRIDAIENRDRHAERCRAEAEILVHR